ncbi:insulinase family protein [Psychrobium sp. nBUS_13]|uniref:insulinase family protein n=1 Tax=Psychrobium sp. nBUS_13 TaxID=3395319 RepID=UPI003EBD3D16
MIFIRVRLGLVHVQGIPLITSSNDTKTYRHITLDNGLDALLICDPKTLTSATSLAVNVGHFNDPKDREGLAHLLEHMMFLGTDKYPDPNEYQTYIKQHGGEHNAWTGSEFTNFYFSIDNAHFTNALDRFSDFFIAPKLSGELIAKEIEAVDSEFQLKYKDDSRRLSAVLKECVNPDHPYSQFSVGNKQTLEGNASELEVILRQYYQTHYCASKMKVVMLSNQSLDEQQNQCNNFFRAILNRELNNEFRQVPLYLEDQYSVEIAVIPNKDIKKLTLSFEVAIDDINYYCKPLSYLAFLIGHEGEGSLLSSLKNTGLANSLSAGTGLSGYNFREFSIHIALTELGSRRIDRVIGLVFQTIRMIEKGGIDAWRYTEQHHIMNVAFDFQEPPKAVELVSHLSINMFKYEPQDFVYGDYAMDSFEPDSIGRIVSAMTPETVRLVMVCQRQESTDIAKWYDTPYQIKPISRQRRKLWTLTPIDYSLALPQPNPFVVERLAFTPPKVEKDVPDILIDEEGFRLWHLPQSQFKVPKGHIFTAIDSPIVNQTATSQVLCRLYVELLHDSLAQVTFPAEIAGMHYDIYPHASGVTMHASGYTPKLFLCFEILITKIRERDFPQSRFDEIKHQLTKNWFDQRKAKPINRLFKGLSATLQPHQFEYPTLLEHLELITLDDLQQFVSSLFKAVHLESLVLGDWPTREARLFGDSLYRQISAVADAIPSIPRQVHSLAHQGTLVRAFDDSDEQNSVIVYYQSQDHSPQQVALWSLASQLLSPLFFAQIRTNQQLGYVCGASYMPINRYPGIMLYVQSSVATPQEVLSAIDNVLVEFRDLIEDMDEEQWQRSCSGLKSKINTRDTSARSQATRHWTSICNRDIDFSHREKTLNAVTLLTPDHLIDFIDNILIKKDADRLIMVTGDASESPTSTIVDINAFKAQTAVLYLTPD